MKAKITISIAVVDEFGVSIPGLKPAMKNVPYGPVQILPVGGTLPYIFGQPSIAGMTCDQQGIVSGTPQASGTCDITVEDSGDY